MEINDLDAYLPQQPPIRMIERVVDLEPGKSGAGVRLFREEDPFFAGHFPGNPILPGVLITEAFAQTAMVVLRADVPADGAPAEGFLAKIDAMSFRRQITPGQQIHFRIQLTRKVKTFFMVDCQAFDGDDVVAKGSLTLSLAQ